MPPLDQYIFLHEIITLIFSFFLLYAYVRNKMLPKICISLKYRNRKLEQLRRFRRAHEVMMWTNHRYKILKGTYYINFQLRSFMKEFNFYEKFTNLKMKNLLLLYKTATGFNLSEFYFNSKVKYIEFVNLKKIAYYKTL